MPDVQEVFRLATNKVDPDPDALERQVRRQRAESRKSRVRAYIAVAALIIVAALSAWAISRSTANGPVPEQTGPRSPDHLSFATTLSPVSYRQEPTVVDLQGRETSTISGVPVQAFSPSLTTDGSRMAFVDAPEELSYNQIGLMNADGSGAHFVPTPGIVVDTVAISPDGSRIAFAGEQQGLADIYVVNADGTGLRRLTSDPATDQYPQWSPDGQTIVYDNAGTDERTSDPQFSSTADIWRVPADGSEPPTQLTTGGSDDNAPSFSPDERSIAYFHKGELWLMAPNGSHQRMLVKRGGFTPRWSPDGTKIAMTYYVRRWRPTVQFGQDLNSQAPLVVLAIVDVSTATVTDLSNVGMATDTNTPQWVDTRHVLVMRVPARDPGTP